LDDQVQHRIALTPKVQEVVQTNQLQKFFLRPVNFAELEH